MGLFSLVFVGGFDLAAEWMGWENKFHCEWNEFGQKVLHHYWPNAEQFTDITKTDFTPYANRIDILTGGFPCQPYSLAGKRKGKDDERHLWPEMLRAIREISPRWVVGENVFGLINWNGGLVFDEVQTDLEAQGYEVFPYVLPACAVNAPHRRDRVWFVAHAKIQREQSREQGKWDEGWFEQLEVTKQGRNCFDTDGARITANTDSKQRSKGWLHTERPEQAERYAGACNARGHKRTTWDKFPTQSPICTGNDGFPAESLRQRIREDSLGYLSEKEIDKIISKAHTKWCEETIKAAGNAIVPQVALQIFKAIQQYENILTSK